MSADAQPRRLVLLRHGQTAWNKAGRVQGQLDAELDDTGRRQAAETAPVIAAMGPVALWSSDSLRARDTAAYVAKESGLDPTYDARLREYYLAERQGLTHTEYAEAALVVPVGAPKRQLLPAGVRRDAASVVWGGQEVTPRWSGEGRK